MKLLVVGFVCLLILGAGAYTVLPLITEELIEQECSQTDPSQACLARMRAAGHIRSQRGDLSQAKAWYLRAAEHGDANAMFHLAWVYEELAHATLLQDYHFREERVDVETTFLNVLESVELQNAIEDPTIPLALKVGGNWAHARSWYLKSAHLDFSPSMNNLARLYFLGLGGDKDLHTSYFWYLKAVNRGNPVSLVNIGLVSIEIEEKDYTIWQTGNWIPKSDVNLDVSEPTLARTKGLGFDIPGSARSRIRESAKKGEAVRIMDLLDPAVPISSYKGGQALKPNSALRTFEDVVRDMKDEEYEY